MTLRQKIGQMIMTGFPEPEITGELIELIEDYKIGNIILFSFNIQTMSQIRGVCKELHSRIEAGTGCPAWIAIDQEGGVVTRLPRDAVNIPGAMLLGATGKPEYAYEAGRITGRELKSVGITIDLAPSADVNTNAKNPVIGVRSYGSRPEEVGRFVVGMAQGLQAEGVMAVVKHFPGHGDTEVDSHLGLPIIEKTQDQLEPELSPFREAVKAGVAGAMSSHILFPLLETERKPATMSETILTGLLRDQLGFEGIIFTDCMEMGAIKEHYGTAKGVVEAIKAGAQVICISHTPALVKEAVLAIEVAVKSGEIPESQIDKAAEAIIRSKRCYHSDFSYRYQEQQEKMDREWMKQVYREGITKVTKAPLPALDGKQLFISCYAYRSTLASSSADKDIHFGEYLSEHLGGSSLVCMVNPDYAEIAEIAEKAENNSMAVIGLYNGHLNWGQVLLANELYRRGINVIGIALRNPYDLADLAEGIHKIAAYEYNQNVFDGLIQLLGGRGEYKGRLPVELTTQIRR